MNTPLVLAASAAALYWAYLKGDGAQPTPGGDTGYGPTPADDWDWADLDMEDWTETEAGFDPTSSPVPGSGYDVDLFPGFVQVREMFNFIGYDMASYNTAPPSSLVAQFQAHYNQASEADFGDASGYLVVDGVAGEATLRALKRASQGTDGPTIDDLARGVYWQDEFGLWD